MSLLMNAPAATQTGTVHFVVDDWMGFARPRLYRQTEDGPLLLEGVPVFRSGTFRDSMGEQHIWQDYDLRQMVLNFQSARDSMLFPHVPVRDMHRSFFGGGGHVVGWHTDLRTEARNSPVTGMQYEYLLADLEITEPDAAGKIERGTWRNRSAEVGRYTTNDEQEIWPFYFGVAYVDIPAVEGLEGFSRRTAEGQREEIFVYVREAPTVTTPNPPRPVLPSQAAPGQVNLYGQATADPAAIQRHVDVLEQFRRETEQGNRDAFVAELVQTNRILASQHDTTQAFARSLTSEQFGSWRATWDVQAPAGLLGAHGQQTPPASNNGGVAAPSDVDTAEEIVRQHQLAGMSQATIERTPSFAKLVQAGKRQFSPAQR